MFYEQLIKNLSFPEGRANSKSLRSLYYLIMNLIFSQVTTGIYCYSLDFLIYWLDSQRSFRLLLYEIFCFEVGNAKGLEFRERVICKIYELPIVYPPSALPSLLFLFILQLLNLQRQRISQYLGPTTFFWNIISPTVQLFFF